MRSTQIPARQRDGERRDLTMLFCDVVDSTRIAATMDPEDWRELVGRFNAAADRAVSEFGGTIAQYRGDSVLAYFGWPVALERSSEAALHATLAILNNMKVMNAGSAGRGIPALAVRIGVHSGHVVIDRSGEAYGDAANVAARIQAAADPGQALVSDVIRWAAAGRFQFTELGLFELKGVARPMGLHRLDGVGVAGRQAEASAPLSAQEMSGRTDALHALLRAWNCTQRGQGTVVTIQGNPGIGKTRLVQEFLKCIAPDLPIVVHAEGSTFYANSPFHAVVRSIELILQGRLNADKPTREHLRGALRFGGVLDPGASRLVRELLGQLEVSVPSGVRAHSALVEIIKEWVVGVSRRHPTVVVCEDVQWLDASSAAVLDAICAGAASRPLLIIQTVRSTDVTDDIVARGQSGIVLPELGDESIREIVLGMLRGQVADQGVVDRVVARSNGVPLFAEELTRLSLSTIGGPDGTDIPKTLADALMTRLDGLGRCKAVAQIAAVLGMEMRLDVLQEVLRRFDGEAGLLVESLARAQIVDLFGSNVDGTLRFRHSLMRDAAYESLLRSDRRAIHRHAADTLELAFPAIAEATPGLLARHWHGARQIANAVKAWKRAADLAARRGAFRDAETIYRDAIESLASYSRDDVRDELEIDLLLGVAGTLQVTSGYSAPQTVSANLAVQAALERTNAVKKSSQIMREWAALSSSGNYSQSMPFADALMVRAKTSGNAVRLAEAHMAQMTTTYRLGQLTRAEALFAEGERFFAAEAFRKSPGAIPQTYGNASQIAWMLGRFDQARARIRFVLDTAAETGSHYDLAFGCYMDGILALLMDQPEHAYESASKSYDLSIEHAYPQFASISRVVLGRAEVDLDNPARGVEHMLSGLAQMERASIRVARTLYLAWLAQGYAAIGELGRAIDTCRAALANNLEEVFFLPEVYCRKAEVEFASGEKGHASVSIETGIAAARSMGAVFLEYKALELKRTLLTEPLSPDDSNRITLMGSSFRR